MLEKLDEAKEQIEKLDAKADSLVDKAIDVLNKVKESKLTSFFVGAAFMLAVVALV